MRFQWTPEQEERLLARINALRSQNMHDVTIYQTIATEMGISYTAITSKHWKLATKQQSKIISVPESRYPLWNAPFNFDGNVLVLCDAHIPLHNAKFINQCISMAAEMGVRRCLLAGNALDMGGMNHFPENFEPSAQTISTDKATRLKAIAESLPADSPQRTEILQEIDQSTDDPHNVSGEWATGRRREKFLLGADVELWQ